MPRETGMHVEGVNRLLRLLREMGGDLSEESRKASGTLAQRFLSDLRGEADTSGERRAADAFRVYRDRIPKVGFSAGKAAGVSGGAKLSELFYGLEFGGRGRATTMQFREHRGRAGYWFYPVLRAEGERYAEDWFRAIMDVLGAEWDRKAVAP